MLNLRVVYFIISPKTYTKTFSAFSCISSLLTSLHPIIFISCNKFYIPSIAGTISISVLLIFTINKAKQHIGLCICLYRFSRLCADMFANFPFPSPLQLPASGNGSLLQLLFWQTHIKIFLNVIHLSNQIENTDEQKAPAK